MALWNGQLEAAVRTMPSNRVELGSINTDMVDSNVEVEATIKSITLPHEGSRAPVKIELADATGNLTLVVWPDMFENLKAQSPLSDGDVIYINAKVTTYRNDLQLQIHAPSDVRIVSKSEPEKPTAEAAAPAAPNPPAATTPAPPSQPATPETTTPLADITTAMIGKTVTVQAIIAEIREPSSERAPYLVTLTQNNTQIPLVYWSDLQKRIKIQPKVGDRVRVNGQVSEYRGTLQIKLSTPSGLAILTGS